MTRRVTAHGDDGTTLPELLISMVLTSLVVALVAATFVSTVRITRVSQQKLTQSGDAVVALDSMSRRLRVAVVPTGTTVVAPAVPTAFESATATSTTFYALLEKRGTPTPCPTSGVTVPGCGELKPTRVTYAVDTTRRCLLETLANASGTAAPYSYLPADSISRCIAYGSFSSRSRLFSYYPDGQSATAFDDGTGSVGPADLCRIRSVRIDLTVTGGSATSGTSVVSRLTLPNIPSTSCGGS